MATINRAFMLAVDMNNAAFDDGDDGRTELVRILREAATRVSNGLNDFVIMDINGNKVGGAGISEDVEGAED